MIKKLLGIVVLGLLWCNHSFGAINDVYYCEMNKIVEIKGERIAVFNNEKFKFKRDKEFIKFGSDKNLFENLRMKIEFSSGEMFDGSDASGMSFSYVDGKFHFSFTTHDNITAVTAECSVF